MTGKLIAHKASRVGIEIDSVVDIEAAPYGLRVFPIRADRVTEEESRG